MTPSQIAMSLVLATRGRSDPINAFLDSVSGQENVGIEIVIVDQNPDDRIERLLAARRDSVPIRRTTSPPGVSRARNVGVTATSGAVIGFPDDDCWYPPGLLKAITKWFEDHADADGLSCKVNDAAGRDSAGGYMSTHSHWISRRNVWRSVVSPGLFVRRHVHTRVGGFDERLGVGAGTPWGSAEESDYVLRAIHAGMRIRYEPMLRVVHPRKLEHLSTEDIARCWRYGLGMGYVLAKNGWGPAATMYYASLPIGTAAAALCRGRVGRTAARISMSAGRCVGWWRARQALSQ